MSRIVSYENKGTVAVITLNRPDAMNAFTTELSNDLQLAMERAADDVVAEKKAIRKFQSPLFSPDYVARGRKAEGEAAALSIGMTLEKRAIEQFAALRRKVKGDAAAEKVVDDLIVWGAPELCREHIGRYVANGVTTPALALLPFGIDPRQAMRDLAPR